MKRPTGRPTNFATRVARLGSKGTTPARSGSHILSTATKAECSLLGQRPVLAGIEKQWCKICRFVEFFNSADENRMVAAHMTGFVGQLETGAATGQQRRAAGPPVPRQTGEAVDRPGGKTVGKVVLAGSQDIDGMVAGAAEGLKVVRSVVEAPEHQRWLQRNGREGIGRQADRLSFRVERRDDGNAGRKASIGVAQGAAVVLNLGHRVALTEKGRIIRAPHPHVEADLSAVPAFSGRLIAWQKAAGRHDLPWQRTRDPYLIWLSEIMLQQTQVATVIPYFQRFLARFPTLRDLAEAPPEAVIEHWAGLGYYARARNLHRCALQLVAVDGEKWPISTEQLSALPGIGRSTAAAITVFAFGQRSAILDGNVKRVLCRHFGIAGFPGQATVERELWTLAERLLPDTDIEAYTQGLMDLGATVCTRRRPRCADCPLAATCAAQLDGRQGELPATRPRPRLPERRTGFVLISDGQRLLLERRPPHGLWGGLLAPPEGEATTVLARFGLGAEGQRELAPLKHAFTHFRLTLEPVLCRVKPTTTVNEPGLQWVAIDAAAGAGVPTPIRKLIERITGDGG